MKQSGPLELVEPGSLARTGPVGRLMRLALGAACLWALWELVANVGAVIAAPIAAAVHPSVALLIAMAFWVISYLVNIGFSKSWGRRPAYASLAGFLAMGVVAFVIHGELNSPILGVPLFAWLTYFYGHLGLSFVVASVLATPGCEMRAIPELVGRMTGHGSAEHHCPSPLITKIDEWERQRIAA